MNLLTRPLVVVGAFCTNKDTSEICLVRTHKKPDLLTIPGGKVKFNEKISDAVIRELKEETGNTAQNLKYKGWGELLGKDHWIMFNYLCTSFDPVAIVSRPKEIIDVVWMPIQKAINSNELSRRLREELKLFY